VEAVDPIEVEDGLFLVLGLDHQVHVVRQVRGQFRAPVRVHAELERGHGTRHGLGEELLRFDAPRLPGLVDEGDELGRRATGWLFGGGGGLIR